LRYKLIIAYNGTSYCGWQIQKSDLSIQALVQQALNTVLQQPILLKGAGRTDAGVHAKGQTAHFDTDTPLDTIRFIRSLNSLLPSDIRILEVSLVPQDFHARYSALSKIYHYHLQLDPIEDAFNHPYRHPVRGPCDLALIKKAIPYLTGTQNFTSLANKTKKGPPTKNGIRTLYRLDLIEEIGGVRFEFEANGFLYKMARNITGLLINVGAGKIEPGKIPEILNAKKRQNLFRAAPPQGLFLYEVKYPKI
jgi:tRNA pseudouridine38-40 synthase